tara:strand:+ start:3295 stop:3489 length:195 start_codon:yes stop_codon:yes gene_type:complete
MKTTSEKSIYYRKYFLNAIEVLRTIHPDKIPNMSKIYSYKDFIKKEKTNSYSPSGFRVLIGRTK